MTYPHEPMYGWALTPEGFPVPIAEAQRGQRYLCPVCRKEMIPKMGDLKQHHFAHLNLLDCTPDNVARAVAGRWLLQTLNHALASGKPVFMEWKSQDTTYKVDILKNIVSIVENHPTPQGQADIALSNKAGETKVIIMLGLGRPPDTEQIQNWTRAGTAVIVLNPVGVRTGQIHLDNLLAESEISGGSWLLDEKQLPPNLVREPQMIRRLLRRVARKPPYRFYGELHSEGAFSHLLDIEGQKLWLPLEVWRDVVGGARNRISADVEVLLQTWELQEGGQMALFYIMARGTAAVAIRRFGVEENVAFNLGTSAFRLQSVTALDLARHLAGGPINFPA